jgi:hypothetical protein
VRRDAKRNAPLRRGAQTFECEQSENFFTSPHFLEFDLSEHF